MTHPSDDSLDEMDKPDKSESSQDADSDESHTVVKVTESGLIVNKTKNPELRTIGEEAWNSAGEALVSSWADDCLHRSKTHGVRETRAKFFHSVFGLPSILLPVVLAALTPIIDQFHSAAYIQVSGLVTIGVVSSVNTFYNFDKKAARHAEYSARYQELANDVQYQLFKGREFRVSSDEFIARVQTKYNNLNEKAP